MIHKVLLPFIPKNYKTWYLGRLFFIKGEHWSKMISCPNEKKTILTIFLYCVFKTKLDKNKSKVPTCTPCSYLSLQVDSVYSNSFFLLVATVFHYLSMHGLTLILLLITGRTLLPPLLTNHIDSTKFQMDFFQIGNAKN